MHRRELSALQAGSILKLLLALLLALGAQCQPDPPETWVHPNPAVEQWHDEAIDAGWDETQWPRLACIIQRESHGDETAYNGRDPGYGSFGLLQLNMSKGRFGTWAAYAPILSGDITHLYTPEVNLAVGLDLYMRSLRMFGSGWRPWGGCR